MLLHLAGTDKHMDNLCKQRAYHFHHSFIIIHTEGGQSACFVEVNSVTEQILQKFPIPQKPPQTVCTRLFFLCPCTRACECGLWRRYKHYGGQYDLSVWHGPRIALRLRSCWVLTRLGHIFWVGWYYTYSVGLAAFPQQQMAPGFNFGRSCTFSCKHQVRKIKICIVLNYRSYDAQLPENGL